MSHRTSDSAPESENRSKRSRRSEDQAQDAPLFAPTPPEVDSPPSAEASARRTPTSQLTFPKLPPPPRPSASVGLGMGMGMGRRRADGPPEVYSSVSSSSSSSTRYVTSRYGTTGQISGTDRRSDWRPHEDEEDPPTSTDSFEMSFCTDNSVTLSSMATTMAVAPAYKAGQPFVISDGYGPFMSSSTATATQASKKRQVDNESSDETTDDWRMIFPTDNSGYSQTAGQTPVRNDPSEEAGDTWQMTFTTDNTEFSQLAGQTAVDNATSSSPELLSAVKPSSAATRQTVSDGSSSQDLVPSTQFSLDHYPTENAGVPEVNALQAMLNQKRAAQAQNAKAADQSSTPVENALTDSSSQQQQQNTSNTSGGLFGNTNQNAQAQPSTGGLFGNATQQNQPQQTGSLFGATTTQNQNQTTTNTAGGLFGNLNQPQQNSTSGGLFGANNTGTQQSQATGGLFGGNNSNLQQNKPAGGLFAHLNTNNQSSQGGGSLFGANNTATQQNNSNGSLFGSAATQQNKPANSLFGATATAPSNLFSQSATNMSNGMLGGSTLASSTAMQPRQQAPSLLSATQHNQMNQAVPFGRLSMGQAAAAPATVGAAKVDYSGLLPTTRFDDCVDSVKTELEAIDKIIQQQESFARQIEAILPKHEENIHSLEPDVDFIKSKAEEVEQALVTDAQGVEAQRKNTERDIKDAQRCQRVITALTLPVPYQHSKMFRYTSMYGSQQRPQQAQQVGDGEDYDTDLIGNYFTPMALELQKMMTAYANNLSEIEQHMGVIESSTVAQAQQLASRKAGTSLNTNSGDETVRELASTLRGFERSILGVAGVVGECREGVNQMVLGRLNGTLGNMP